VGEQPPLVHQVVLDRATTSPHDEALLFGDRSWSWTQLAGRVEKTAAALRSRGLRAGDRFAVLDRNHPACLELTLAAARIGATNVVVNFRLAADEIAYVLSDSNACLAVVGAEFAELVSGLHPRLPALRDVIVLGGPADEYEAWLAAAPELETPAHEPGPDDCFLQLYTSGTTGRPKGAMLTHRGVGTHTMTVSAAYGMDEHSVNLVAMPLFHVGGTCWALASMYAGGRTVVARDATPSSLIELLRAHGVTHVFLVPTVIEALLADPQQARGAFATVRVLAYGGSPTPASLMRRILETLPTPLYSVYGMTELSGSACMLTPEEHRDPEREHLLSSVGRPLPGVEVRVVDPATGGDLAPGQLGELWIRSEHTMAGYWNQPAATRETLTDDGWLKTGDAGRATPEGHVFIEDRVKDMIISGGENIYPAEVERALAEHPDVADVAVVGLPDAKWGEKVKAVIVPAAGVAPDPDALIEFSRARLAGYKCPAAIEFVATLPRNSTGKVDKRRLRV
jgi:acyl-CoA synthetase (AMP-forming)/AMP-acid ligase II